MAATTSPASTVLPRPPMEAVALVGAVLAGLAVAVAGPLGIVAVVGTIFVLAVARQPMVGIIALVALTPLLSGYFRGVPVPFFRPHELVMVATLIGVGLSGLAGLLEGRRWRLDLQPIDAAFAALAFFGSVVPVLLSIGRSRPIDGSGIGQVVILPKYLLLFLLFRGVVRTGKHVRDVVVVSGVVGVVVAAVGIAQSFFNSQVNDVLLGARYQASDYLLSGRGTSTTGNSIVYGTLMALLVSVALSLLFSHLDKPLFGESARRKTTFGLVASALVYFLGVLSSGQISPTVAVIVVIVVAVAVVRKAHFLYAFPPVAALGVLAIWPQVRRRLDEFEQTGGLPVSWQTRLDNLQRFYLPEFDDASNRVLGVRLDVTADFDQVLGEEVFLESGYVWFIWVGGVFLLLAALGFLFTGLVRTWPRLRESDPWVRAAATASFSAFIYIALLLSIDQHLTLRASTDLFVMLLAASMVRTAAPVRFEDAGTLGEAQSARLPEMVG